jgi:hypothetical protein
VSKVQQCLFNKFYPLCFRCVHTIKKSLFVHPVIAEYFAHVSGSVVGENGDHVTVFIEFAFFCVLLDGLSTAPEV